MSNKLIGLKYLYDLLCKYEVKDLEDLENRLKNVADLEAKLAESENRYAELFCKNTELEILYSQKTALVNFYKDTDLVKENEQLQKQLAEKDEQLRAKIGNMKSNDFIKICLQCGLMVDAKEKDNQDKISFAVEQIVKTKETLIKFLQDEGFYENEWYDLFDKIDNQIKQLKEGK